MMDPNASALYRVAFVKAFWGVVAEGETLPWNPTVDASLAGYIRQLFNVRVVRRRWFQACRKFELCHIPGKHQSRTPYS